MKDLEEKYLQFVLRYYRQNKLDTQKALERFKAIHRLDEPKRRRNLIGWMASGTAAAVLMGICFYTLWMRQENESWQTITTQAEIGDFLLPDSSSVRLYPYSSIQFDAGRDQLPEREVRMSGKVRFQVKPMRERPFVVKGLLAQVKVLGTVFTVDESSKDTVKVEVETGKVAFAAVGQAESVVLTQGMAAQ